MAMPTTGEHQNGQLSRSSTHNTSQLVSASLVQLWNSLNSLSLISHIQVELTNNGHSNMLVRDRFEKEYAPLYKLYNYGTTVWSPLYQGILTGKYNDGVPEDSRYGKISKSDASKFDTPETKAQIEKVRKLSSIAEKVGGSMASLALAWVIKNPHVSVAILGATKAEQITENVKCLEILPKMTDEVMEEIEKILENKPEVMKMMPMSRLQMTMNKALM